MLAGIEARLDSEEVDETSIRGLLFAAFWVDEQVAAVLSA